MVRVTASVAELWCAVSNDDASHGRSWSPFGRDDAPAAPTDALLVRIRAGDATAFTDVYVTYAGRLSNYARSYLPDRTTAEELVHDVLASLWRNRTRLTVRSTFVAYLYGAVRFAALKWVRDTNVRDHYLSAAASDAVLRAEEPDHATADQVWEQRRAALARAVGDLPPRCREVFLLRWRDELPYADIAAVMGISIKTVEMQMTTAIKRLRVRFAGTTET